MIDMPNYPDVVQWAVPLFVAAILAELLWIVIKHRGGRYETCDALTSLILGAGSVAEGIVLGLSPGVSSWRSGRSRRLIWATPSG